MVLENLSFYQKIKYLNANFCPYFIFWARQVLLDIRNFFLRYIFSDFGGVFTKKNLSDGTGFLGEIPA